MNCDDIREQLSALMDGALDHETAQAVENHLSVCNACSNERDILASLDQALAAAFYDELTSADDVAAHVLQRLNSMAATQTANPVIRPRPKGRFAGHLTAAVAGFVLAVIILQPGRNDDGPPGEGRGVSLDPRSLPGANNVPETVPVAVFKHATGPVSMWSPDSGDWVSISREKLPAFACPSNSVVKTEPGSLCELETAEGCVVRLNESSEVALRSNEELELVSGQLWCRTADGEIRLTANEATAEVDVTDNQSLMLVCPTNTAFLTSCAPAEPLQVAAAAGSVELKAKGRDHRLPSGSYATITNGDVEVREASGELIDAERWMQPLLTLRGHNNPELTDRVNSLLARIGFTKVSYLYEQDLRNLGEYGALPLLRFVQSDESRTEPGKRAVAMRIVQDTAPIWMVPDLIGLLEDKEPHVRSHAAGALTRLTGETQGLSAEDWESERDVWGEGVSAWQMWWERHRYRCQPPPTGVP